MGAYIEFPEPKDKIAQFEARFPTALRLAEGDPIPLPSALADDLALVCCVVNLNRPFDAVAVVYDDFELARFTSDDRPKAWFLLERGSAAAAAHIEGHDALWNRYTVDSAPEAVASRLRSLRVGSATEGEPDPGFRLLVPDGLGGLVDADR